MGGMMGGPGPKGGGKANEEVPGPAAAGLAHE